MGRDAERNHQGRLRASSIECSDAVPGLKRVAPRPMSNEEARSFMDKLIASVPPSEMTLEDALGRSRRDPPER